MNKNTLYKSALTGILSALATLTFMIESLFPPIILPGARMGLSNVFILFCAITIGGKYGFIVLAIKTLIGSLFSGNLSAIMYSLPAGVISLSVELLIIHYIKRTSVICASVVGSVVNVTIQNLIFCLISSATEYLVYLPYLSIISVFSGIIVGFTVYLLVKFVPIK